MIKFNNLDIDNITNSAFNNQKISYLMHNGKPIYIQTPKLYCPFGITSFNINGIDKYSLNVSFSNKDFYEKMIDLESKVKSFIDKKYEYKSIFQYSKNKQNFLPYLNLKIACDFKTEKVITKFCDKNSEKLKVSLNNLERIMPTKSYVKLILYISNIWIVDNKCGITIKPYTIMLYPKLFSNGECLLDSD